MNRQVFRIVAALVAAALLGLAPTPSSAQTVGVEGVIAIDVELDPNSSGFWVLDQLGRVYPTNGAPDLGAIENLSDLRPARTSSR